MGGRSNFGHNFRIPAEKNLNKKLLGSFKKMYSN